ncbi:hypothetical protein SLS62_002287 [Diatrype stigma]|uniref:Cytochrome P450 n=1 Tax=Diatrype stigma TaxID=117547 RepID=A0AAN9YSG0_9PEZI
MTGLSKEGHETASYEPLENHGWALGIARTIHQTLAPGPRLDVLNRRSVEYISESLNTFALGKKPKAVSMYKWITHEVLLATTEGIYAGKFVKARDLVQKSYERYFLDQGHRHPDTPPFTKERTLFEEERGLSTTDMAKMETATSIGILANTLPATFWLVYHIVSDPEVLEDCRTELFSAVKESDDGNTYEVDMTCIKTSCPILFSTFQEVFRFRGTGVSARMMMDDFLLDNTYLLKKGNIVLIPAAVQHGLPSAWGDNVHEFYHKRFIREQGGAKSKRHNPVAFRGFGGGSTLCPGRHFAATEILAFASLIIMRFNIRPVQGYWPTPTVENANAAISIQTPDHDIDVEIEPQNEKRWVVTFSGSDKPMDIAAEDIEEREDKKNVGDIH